MPLIAESTVVRLCELDVGDKAQTESGKFVVAGPGLTYHDEIGRSFYPADYDEPATILNEWPILQEGDHFRLAYKPKVHPYEHLIFEKLNGFKFRIRTDNYRFKIPFVFRSTDPRIKYGHTFWSCDSGQAARMMWREQGFMGTMYIEFGTPHHILYLNGGVKTFKCPSSKETQQS